MYKLPTFIIQYANEISFRDITFFRGAIIASTKDKDILFHNHEDDEKLRYSYPKIQYKRINKKATIIGIGDGIGSVSQLLTIGSHECMIGSEKVDLKIEGTRVFDNEICLSENTDFCYRLRNWLPLNSENYKKYRDAENLVDRIQILEHVLVGNILSMLKGVDIHLGDKEEVKVNITDIIGQRAYTYKNVKLMAFDIEFKSNITLPQYIGIGKNASVGCGVLMKMKRVKSVAN